MGPLKPNYESMNYRACVLLSLLLVAPALMAQGASTSLYGRALSHEDYDSWNSLKNVAYSNDGKWVAYQVDPAFGDGELVIRQTEGDVVHRHALASSARFSADGRYVGFTVGKSSIEAREKQIAELRKKGKAQQSGGAAAPTGRGGRGGAFAGRRPTGAAAPSPVTATARRRGASRGGRFGRGGRGGGSSDSGGSGDLFLLDLQSGNVESIGKVSRWTMSSDITMLLYQLSSDGDDGGEEGSGGADAGARGGRRGGGRRGRQAGGRGAPTGADGSADSGRSRRIPSGSELLIRNLATGKKREITDVVSYGLVQKSTALWFHRSAQKSDNDQEYGVFVQAPDGEDSRQLLDGLANVSSVTVSRDGQHFAFLSDKVEFGDDKPNKDLYLWSRQRDLSAGGDGMAKRIAYIGAVGMPPSMRVDGQPSFSRDGNALSFTVSSPTPPPELPILDEDKVELDLWSYRDGLLQTMQAVRRGRGGSAKTAVYWADTGKLLVVGDERIPSLRFIGMDGARMLGSDSVPYEKEVQWDTRYSDQWLVDAHNGERTRVIAKLRGRVSSSPGGRYLTWFDEKYHWICMDVATGERRNLTGSLKVPFHKYDDDHPAPAAAYGLAGWTEDDGAVLLYDEFDLWRIAPESGRAVCVTDGFGREHRLQFRLQQMPSEDDSPWIGEELLLSARNMETMAMGFYADAVQRSQMPAKLWMVNKSIRGLTSPKKSARLFFNLSTFREYGDLWTAKADFSAPKKLTDVNPQQEQFRWGDSEIVKWTDGNGESRSGVLIKPDGFDPNKQYPMMVYFYEKMTQNLHRYVAPASGTSPNASYYVSNGYLWFMPDVVYEVGYPGPSCVKCVVSGVQHLISQGFVDKDAIGAAGHSWGGYQTAFLVTRTNIFKAVESGAPVSNMLSAYGGIRYDSGMSRQFQYEQTQSRIGGTPWQYPLRYTENSPIHFADKVQTPVLILHNDKDGAVPWTQGIEYFVALKRLGKEAYFFNYNGEPHGLRKSQNKNDWTRRMAEYFDHHLRGAEAPDWMTKGVAYKDRDSEKLPFAKSYIEAHVKPSAKLLAMEAEEEAKAKSRSAERQKALAEKAAMEPSKVSEAVELSSKSVEPDPANGRLPSEGKKAPDFALFDEADVEHQLGDYRGQKLLVWFYPKAGTPGCTAQGCGLRDEYAQLQKQGVAILGVSFDNARANTAFRDKNRLPFPLLCDTGRKMAVAYGAAADEKASYASRVAVLIGEQGRVLKSWESVNPRSFASEVIGMLTQ